MDRGLYIAASGMLAEQTRQDALANDLANGSTPGYKPDRTTQRDFSQMLLANDLSGRVIGPPGTGVAADGTPTHLRQGALRATGQALDVPVAGDGFLAIQ